MHSEKRADFLQRAKSLEEESWCNKSMDDKNERCPFLSREPSTHHQYS